MKDASPQIENLDQDRTEDEPPPEKPRKIMLGKRVLRHFTVKSGVKTGEGTSASIFCIRCMACG